MGGRPNLHQTVATQFPECATGNFPRHLPPATAGLSLSTGCPTLTTGRWSPRIRYAIFRPGDASGRRWCAILLAVWTHWRRALRRQGARGARGPGEVSEKAAGVFSWAAPFRKRLKTGQGDCREHVAGPHRVSHSEKRLKNSSLIVFVRPVSGAGGVEKDYIVTIIELLKSSLGTATALKSTLVCYPVRFLVIDLMGTGIEKSARRRGRSPILLLMDDLRCGIYGRSGNSLWKSAA